MTKCTVRGCTKDHRKDDAILDGVFDTPVLDLAQNYLTTLAEIGESMLADKNADRGIAFFSRIRDVNECYYRTLWSCLIATREEIVHDANFVIYHRRLNQDSISRTYDMIVGNLQNEIRVLQYVRDSLAAE